MSEQPCVDPRQQLVLEIYVSSLAESIRFLETFGFSMQRKDGGFAVMEWEGCQLFLAESDAPRGADAGNVRIMVPDVDRYWARAERLGVEIDSTISDREYGLRDFTVRGPDGIAFRFASWLPEPG